MRVKVAFFAALFFVAAISLMSGQKAHAEQSKNTEKQQKIVTVEKGDSLSKIAKRHETTYPRVFYANPKIENPDLIYPGDKLRIPGKDEKLTKRPIPGRQAAATTTRQPERAASQSTAQASGNRYTAPRQSEREPAAQPVSTSSSVWDRLAQCESSGNWSINTGNGYYGGLQFSLASWRAVGGVGYPHQASKAEQIARAERLLAVQGWGAWPACSAKLGLR